MTFIKCLLACIVFQSLPRAVVKCLAKRGGLYSTLSNNATLTGNFSKPFSPLEVT